MVSKIPKKIPTKLPKHCRSHSRKTSSVIKSINRSLSTCHRHLLKLFSKLSHLGSPNRRPYFKILKTTPTKSNPEERKTLIPKTLFFNKPLPPLTPPTKPTIFLDLDETLVHSKPDPPPARFDFVVRPIIDGDIVNFYVLKRPGVEEFLAALREKFEVVLFTAGLRQYASLVIDKIDQTKVVSHRLYRDSCKKTDGKYVKDLSDFGRDLKRVVILDDNPNAYVFQPENAIHIRPFVDDMGDRELGKLIKFFEVCDCYEDMRDAVKCYYENDGKL